MSVHVISDLDLELLMEDYQDAYDKDEQEDVDSLVNHVCDTCGTQMLFGQCLFCEGRV